MESLKKGRQFQRVTPRLRMRYFTAFREEGTHLLQAIRPNRRVDPVKEYARLVHHLAAKYFPAATESEREELAAVGLAGVCRAVQTFRADAGAGRVTYAGRCALNAMRQEWKRLTRQARLQPLSLDAPVGDVDALTLGDAVALRVAGPEEDCIQREESAALWGLVDELPDLYRDVVRLHYGEGLTLPEVGARVGLPPTVVHGRLATARNRLRRMARAG